MIVAFANTAMTESDTLEKQLLHRAGEGDVNVDVVRSLLEQKVSANCTDTCSPLYFAAWRGDLEIVKVLLEHKADTTAKYTLCTKQASTPLEAAKVSIGRAANDPKDDILAAWFNERLPQLKEVVKLLTDK